MLLSAATEGLVARCCQLPRRSWHDAQLPFSSCGSPHLEHADRSERRGPHTPGSRPCASARILPALEQLVKDVSCSVVKCRACFMQDGHSPSYSKLITQRSSSKQRAAPSMKNSELPNPRTRDGKIRPHKEPTRAIMVLLRSCLPSSPLETRSDSAP